MYIGLAAPAERVEKASLSHFVMILRQITCETFKNSRGKTWNSTTTTIGISQKPFLPAKTEARVEQSRPLEKKKTMRVAAPGVEEDDTNPAAQTRPDQATGAVETAAVGDGVGQETARQK